MSDPILKMMHEKLYASDRAVKIYRQELFRLEDQNKKLKEEIDDLYGGKRGACFACEPCALLNIKLEKENKELKERLEYTEYNPKLGKL